MMFKISKWTNQQFVDLVCLFGSVFIYCFAIGIYAAVIPNFIQQKVCSPDSEPYFEDTCNDTSLLLEAADIITTRGMIREAVPVIIILLAGSWRDATGRNKPLVYTALTGEIIGASILLLATWNWSISIWTASIAEAVLYGMFGGSKLFYVAATCAITDQSSDEERTGRLMFYQVAAYTGACLSTGVSGYGLQLLGYKLFFTMVIFLHLLTTMLFAFSTQIENVQEKGEKTKMFEKMKAITKSRPNNLVIWIMVISCVIINVVSSAENNLYLYFLQMKFDFTVKETGIYMAFRQICAVVGTMILSPVFTKVLRWSDFRIGILSSFMTFIATVLMIFAKTIAELIIYGMLDFLKIFLHTMPMSIVTKCLKSDEIGIFVSLRFIGGCLSPTLFYYIYDLIFSATSDTMPGAFFIASSIVTLIVFFSFWISSWIYTEPFEDLEHQFTIKPIPESCENGDKY